MRTAGKAKELKEGFLYADFSEIRKETTLLRYEHSDNEFDYFSYFSGEKWQKFENGLLKSKKGVTWYNVPLIVYPINYLKSLGIDYSDIYN